MHGCDGPYKHYGRTCVVQVFLNKVDDIQNPIRIFFSNVQSTSETVKSHEIYSYDYYFMYCSYNDRKLAIMLIGNVAFNIRRLQPSKVC